MSYFDAMHSAKLSILLVFSRASLSLLDALQPPILPDPLLHVIAVGITLALAWYTFCRSSGLSPLAGGQWSKFLLTYATIYATLGTVRARAIHSSQQPWPATDATTL
eukprot:1974766-Pleurochrysis_carterae.AAC.5